MSPKKAKRSTKGSSKSQNKTNIEDNDDVEETKAKKTIRNDENQTTPIKKTKVEKEEASESRDDKEEMQVIKEEAEEEKNQESFSTNEGNTTLKPETKEEGEEEEEEGVFSNVNWEEIIPQTIESLKDPKGTTLQSLRKFLCAKFGVKNAQLPVRTLRSPISNLVDQEILEQITSQRWKLGPKFVSKKRKMKRASSIIHAPLDKREEQEFFELYGLPPDMFVEILSYLEPIPELINCFQVSKQLQRLASHPRLWRNLDFSVYPNIPKEDLIRFITISGDLLQSFDVSLSKNFDGEVLRVLNEKAPNLETLKCDIDLYSESQSSSESDDSDSENSANRKKLEPLLWPKLTKLVNRVFTEHPKKKTLSFGIATFPLKELPFSKKFNSSISFHSF